jgi:2-iminobutanoate/2-iminopropanoate deaminase
MPKKHVVTRQAPTPIGPYSQGVIAGGFLFLSGQIPIDPQTNELVSGGVEAQAERVLLNILAVLKEAKMGPENIVRTTVFLQDLADFTAMNEVYARYLGKEPPARSTVQVAALPRGARIEIDAIAAF